MVNFNESVVVKKVHNTNRSVLLLTRHQICVIGQKVIGQKIALWLGMIDVRQRQMTCIGADSSPIDLPTAGKWTAEILCSAISETFSLHILLGDDSRYISADSLFAFIAAAGLSVVCSHCLHCYVPNTEVRGDNAHYPLPGIKQKYEKPTLGF